MKHLGAILILSGMAIHADEGMWTFDSPPLAQMKASYGFAPDDTWLEHVRLAAVEFGSASGSFVSKDGLVLTNHHVGLRFIEKVSEPGEKDFARKGFVAKTRAEEIKIPELRLYTVMRTINVTDRVNAAVQPGMDEKQATDARMEKLVKLRNDLDQRNGLTAGWVILYKGGEYWLYAYKAHRDVRLVMAPEAQIAYFGGDPDNWTFPRHDLDFALFRVYEGGEPYHPPHHLSWSTEGVKAGDFTLVVGNPDNSRRLETLAQLAYAREVELPQLITKHEAHRSALLEYGRGSEAKAGRVATKVFSLENALKAEKGELAGLVDAAAFGQLEQRESELRTAVGKDPGLSAEAGASWGRIEESVRQRKQLASLNTLMNSRSSRLLGTALELVRGAQELDRPRGERLVGYRTREDEEDVKWRLNRQLAFEDLELETFLIMKGLEDIRDWLAPEHPFRKAVLGDRLPAELAREAVSGTKVATMYGRRDILGRGAKGIAKSTDPLVQLARAIEAFRRDLDQQDDKLQGILKDHSARIAHARFKLHGRTFAPDASGTQRLSYGAVDGYLERGQPVEPFTTFKGLYERAQQMGPVAAFGAWALPERWKERKDRLDLSVPLNFCHKVDILSGNSGSPAINAKGELVGLVFDGNEQSLSGKFYYDGKANRAVSLDSRAILEALVKVYDAPFLADELLSR